MSIHVSLYRNDSPPNAFSKQLTKLWEAEGTLRDSCDILKPALTIQADLSAILNRINYMYIDEFSRFYWTNSPIIVTNEMYAISGKVDPFMSWREETLANKAIVSRQANLYNLFLDDGVFKAYSNPIIQRLNFSGGFTDTSFILVTAGGLNS